MISSYSQKVDHLSWWSTNPSNTLVLCSGDRGAWKDLHKKKNQLFQRWRLHKSGELCVRVWMEGPKTGPEALPWRFPRWSLSWNAPSLTRGGRGWGGSQHLWSVLHPLLGGQWLCLLIPCFLGRKSEVCQLLSKSPNSNTGFHPRAQGGSQPHSKGSPAQWRRCWPASREGCLVIFNLPQTSSDNRGQVPAPLWASASPFLSLVWGAFLMRCPFVLCPFQIECSSISDYSEKIVKANHLDNSKTYLCVLSRRWRG